MKEGERERQGENREKEREVLSITEIKISGIKLKKEDVPLIEERI